MVVAGVVVAIGSIVAAFVMVGVKQLESKNLAWLMLVGAFCGFIIANITTIKDITIKLTGVGELSTTVQRLQTEIATVQQDMSLTAKAAVESQVLLSKSLAAGPATERLRSRLDASVNGLAEIAVRDPQERARWLNDLQGQRY